MNPLKYTMLVPAAIVCAAVLPGCSQPTPLETIKELNEVLESITDLPSAKKATPKLSELFAQMAIFEETQKNETEVTPEVASASMKLVLILAEKEQLFKTLGEQDPAFGLIINSLYESFNEQ